MSQFRSVTEVLIFIPRRRGCGLSWSTSRILYPAPVMACLAIDASWVGPIPSYDLRSASVKQRSIGLQWRGSDTTMTC